MATYYEETEKGLVPAQGDIPVEAIFAIERADDDAIVQSFSGGFAQEHLIYSYPISTKLGKKMIVGVGVKGGNEIARLLGNIEVLPDVRVQEREGFLYGIVGVKDLLRNVTLRGFARQSLFIQTEGMEQTERIDEHAYVKALTKAQRNGVLSLAPQEALVKIVSQFLEQKKLGRLVPPKTEVVQSTTKPTEKPKEKEATKAAPGTKELNEMKAQFMMRWREFGESEDYRKNWLQENFQVDSITKLTAEQLQDAIGRIEGEILKRSSAEETPAGKWSSPGPGAVTEEAPPVEQPALIKEEAGKPEVAEGDQTPATAEQKRDVAKALTGLGFKKDDIVPEFEKVTGKKGGWTNSDISKLSEHVEELRKQAEGAAETTKEADDFLKGLES